MLRVFCRISNVLAHLGVVGGHYQSFRNNYSTNCSASCQKRLIGRLWSTLRCMSGSGRMTKSTIVFTQSPVSSLWLTGLLTGLTLVQNAIPYFTAKRSKAQFENPSQATRTVNLSIIASEILYLAAFMPAPRVSEKLLKTKYISILFIFSIPCLPLSS